MSFLSGLSHLFGTDESNPYDQQIPAILKRYLQPYADQGNAVYSELNAQYNALLNHPNDLLNKMGQSYQVSPSYQFQLNQALNAGHRAAAAKGMLGSPEQQQQAQQTAQQLTNQDFNQYLSQALGLYGQGLLGKQGIYNMGFNASNQLGENLSNALMSQGNLAYTNGINQHQSTQQLLGLLLGFTGGFL